MRMLPLLLLTAVTILVLSFTPTAVAVGCEECLPGGNCTWYSCTHVGGGCYECGYSCPDGQVCTWNTCNTLEPPDCT
jgi:hypothetical protein